MSKEILPIESAEKQLETLFDYYEIELEKDMRADTVEGADVKAERIRTGLIRAIQRGRLEIISDEESNSGELEIVQYFKRKIGDLEKITYYEISGGCRTAVKDVDKGSPAKKVYDMLAAMSRVPVKTFISMKGVDIKTAELLSSVFSLV